MSRCTKIVHRETRIVPPLQAATANHSFHNLPRAITNILHHCSVFGQIANSTNMITIMFLRRFYSQSIHMSAVEAVCDVSEKLLTIFPVSLANSKNRL
jgi:hypothetical protein